MKKRIFLLVNIMLAVSLCCHYGCKKHYNPKPVNPPIQTPTDTVGDASVTPSSGNVGTNITFTVKVRTAFVSKVADVGLDISNTGEHIDLKQEPADNTTWRKNQLWAPETNTNTYPRTDTFTFTAYDSNKGVLGRGSATFKVTGNNNPNSVNPNTKAGYYGKN